MIMCFFLIVNFFSIFTDDAPRCDRHVLMMGDIQVFNKHHDKAIIMHHIHSTNVTYHNVLVHDLYHNELTYVCGAHHLV